MILSNAFGRNVAAFVGAIFLASVSLLASVGPATSAGLVI
jgi:hypothetical protein